MRAFGRGLVVATAVLAAGCASRPQPVPEQAPSPRAPAPRPAPPPAPPPVRDWADLPLTPGSWIYAAEAAGSRASFGGSADGGQFVLRCDGAGRRILLARQGAATGSVTIRTSYGARTLPANAQADGLAATLSASDPLLDQIAFSRGRFTVEVAGQPQLVLPAWPEVARVVEDCRI